MTTGGTNVSGRRKGTFTFSNIALVAGVTNKAYLVGNDGDVGYLPDTEMRITRIQVQGDVVNTDATEDLEVRVCKGTEATVVYLIDATTVGTDLQLDADAFVSTVYSDVESGQTDIWTTSDDLIVVANVSSGADTGDITFNVQIDYEYAD